MPQSTPQDLSVFFSDYRAEWSADLFRDLFIAPPYFAKLEVPRPCVLIGGRGTGKTTALRSLRFDASAARLAADGLAPDVLPYLGIYVRINKNRVRAFQGPSHSDDEWGRTFAHYFNLLCCEEFCRLVEWASIVHRTPQPDLASTAKALCIGQPANATAFRSSISVAITELEIFVNNPTRVERPLLSMAESPLKVFVEALRDVPHFAPLQFFCCVDEYENLLDSQQAVLNTYIKHAEPPLSYKVGVKKNGLRSRATIDTTDALSTPADYAEIEIEHEEFDLFSGQVAQHRLDRARARGMDVPETVDEFLPDLPFASEADRLGCDRIAKQVLDEVEHSGDAALVMWAKAMPRSQIYFVKYWADGGEGSVVDLARDWMSDPAAWDTRLGNYGYASLFWLSKGRKGVRIRKYYAGRRTFQGLASGNIRYFIELIDESLRVAASEVNEGKKWSGFIPQAAQTDAARTVGKRRLDQLEGLSEHGSEIKRLVLAVGKVFFEFARDPIGKSPERSMFVVTGGAEAREQVLSLLREGASNLAFEATPRTKATTQWEIRDDEYRLHPIFAPFFEYSHRRKRRCSFPAETLLEALVTPARAIAALVGHVPTPSEELPVQLALFSSFYESGAVQQ